MKIAPSILSADFLNLGADIRMLNQNADLIHLDVMDGSLVPNISFGFSVIDAVKEIAAIPMDAHLMIVHPERYFKRLADDGVEMTSFHLEAALQQGSDPSEMLQQIRDLGMQAGLAFNPDMPLEKVYPYLKDADFVLIMTVFAGFGGQKIIDNAEERIRSMAEEIRRQGLNIPIEIDGGVKIDNIAALGAAGADIAVAGSQVFKSEDPARTIRTMQGV